MARGKRVLRYVGNRSEPERELFGAEEALHSWIRYPTVDLGIATPDLLTNGFAKGSVGDILYSIRPDLPTYITPFNFQIPWHTVMGDDVPVTTRPAEVDFEVNLVEPLVGWKKWHLDGKYLGSMFGCEWKPLQVMEAACNEKCNKIPAEHHSCGFYAVDERDDIPDDDSDQIVGQVYGWGRYIRGDEGWRAQFAYPKSFHLQANQARYIPKLKRYGVPIYLEQPMQVYFPEEDGYEHRQDDASGSFGTDEGTGAAASSTEGQDD